MGGSGGPRIADVEVTNTGAVAPASWRGSSDPARRWYRRGPDRWSDSRDPQRHRARAGRTRQDARRSRQLLWRRPGRRPCASRSSCATAAGSSPRRRRRPTRRSRRATVRASLPSSGCTMGALMRGLRLVLVASLLDGWWLPRTQVASAAGADRVAQLIGQKLVVRMEGTTPSPICSAGSGAARSVAWSCSAPTSRPAAALISLTAELHAAAGAGGQPPFPDRGRPGGRTRQAHPVGSADALGAGDGPDRDATVARTQGADTGTALHGLGIDIDLAPVADIATTTGHSCIATAGRGRSARSRRRSWPTHSRADSSPRVSCRR